MLPAGRLFAPILLKILHDAPTINREIKASLSALVLFIVDSLNPFESTRAVNLLNEEYPIEEGGRSPDFRLSNGSELLGQESARVARNLANAGGALPV